MIEVEKDNISLKQTASVCHLLDLERTHTHVLRQNVALAKYQIVRITTNMYSFWILNDNLIPLRRRSNYIQHFIDIWLSHLCRQLQPR